MVLILSTTDIFLLKSRISQILWIIFYFKLKKLEYLKALILTNLRKSLKFRYSYLIHISTINYFPPHPIDLFRHFKPFIFTVRFLVAKIFGWGRVLLEKLQNKVNFI